MKRQRKIIWLATQYTLYVLLLLGVIFLCATILWVVISPYTFQQFNIVLGKVLKNAGSYSVLLVGVVITIFFQIYSKEKELEKEDKIKIGEVGYYILAFKREEDAYEESFNNDKMVVEIDEEKDYEYEPSRRKEEDRHFMIKFLTSKRETTNLKNVMAFSENYFETNKEHILKNYFTYCERVTYCSPLYCSTKSTNELENNDKADRNRYFWLVLKRCNTNCIKNFWISALTEEGIYCLLKLRRVSNKRKSNKGKLAQRFHCYNKQYITQVMIYCAHCINSLTWGKVHISN